MGALYFGGYLKPCLFFFFASQADWLAGWLATLIESHEATNQQRQAGWLTAKRMANGALGQKRQKVNIVHQSMNEMVMMAGAKREMKDAISKFD